MAGVVGRQKFFYDVWGDTVNVAARMEQTGQPGQIQIDSETRRLIGSRYRCETRGSVDIHGKGTMETWFLTGLIGECPQT